MNLTDQEKETIITALRTNMIVLKAMNKRREYIEHGRLINKIKYSKP